MCYAKPGPRCSAHAALLLQNAQREYDAAPKIGKLLPKKKLVEARRAWYSTPQGLSDLQGQLQRTTSEVEKSKLQELITMGKETRAAQLTSYAKVNPGKNPTFSDESDEFDSYEQELKIQNAIKEGQRQYTRDLIEQSDKKREERRSPTSSSTQRRVSAETSDSSKAPVYRTPDYSSSAIDSVNNTITYTSSSSGSDNNY